jgi:hypothetical protein
LSGSSNRMALSLIAPKLYAMPTRLSMAMNRERVPPIRRRRS